MRRRELIYLRSPKVLLRDFVWLVGLCQELLASGNKEERTRVLKYAVPQGILFLGVYIFSFAFLPERTFTTLGLLVFLLVPLMFIYGSLLDITRRIRPLNEGPLAVALVLEVWRGRGSWTIRVQSMGTIFDCHIMPLLNVRRVAPGDQVTIGRHPHDRQIAAIIEVTPRAIFAERRRRECAKFLERQKPFKERVHGQCQTKSA